MNARKFRRFAAFLLTLLALCLLTACSNQTDTKQSQATEAPTATAEPVLHSITFDMNDGTGAVADSQQVADRDVAEEPSAPTRENYRFTGWYVDADCTTAADFEYEITADTTYYAGWEMTAATVTYLYNDGTENTFRQDAVAMGSTPVEPTRLPEREGFLFTAWYADAACTVPFDFTAAVSADASVFAGWKEDDGSSVLVTYMWNYDGAPDEGVYRSQRVAYKSYLTLPTPDRGDEHKFIFWYTDPECTQYYDTSKKINKDTTLYALWYNSVTFEAEYVDVSQITGYGYSGSLTGTRIINRDQNAKANASNGWYVSYLYYNGITLTFNIHADQAVDNALLYLRLSAEYYDLSITDEQFLVMVNGQQVKYGSISIPINNAGSSGGVTSSSIEVPFQDFLVSTTLHLNEGDNTISLVVNNFKPENERTGTMYSYAPVVDAIKICSTGDVSAITWAEGFPLVTNLDTANNTYD